MALKKDVVAGAGMGIGFIIIYLIMRWVLGMFGIALF